MSLITLHIADASEVETLKSALAEAKKEAEEERAARLKHESRAEEVQQELKDAISKCESLEHKILDLNPNLLRPSKVHRRPGLKPKAPAGRSKRQSRLRRVRPLTCRANL